MKFRPTIFVSGVSREFASFRDAVEIEIKKKGCFAENQPNFSPDYHTVEEMLRKKLRESDAVIHLAGFRFGAEPATWPEDSPRRSYTQMEFDIARELGIPVYLFLSKKDNVRDKPRTALPAEDEEAVELQLAHRKAIANSNDLYDYFKNKEELARLVAEIPEIKGAGFQADITRIVRYAPPKLIGRENETALLNDAWQMAVGRKPKRPHVLTFVALGGEGKTSLVSKWAGGLAAEDWPGCDTAFAWSFYSQGSRDQIAVSSDLFLTEALTFFGDSAMANSNQGAYDKGKRLAQLVGERRALLILDGLEPLQYAPTSPTPGQLKDQGVEALLKGLATSSQGLCVVTTRYALPDLQAFLESTVQEVKLERLPREAGVALLKAFGVKGSEHRDEPTAKSPDPLNEYEQLVEDVKGHALTLNLLGSYLAEAHAGDIRKRDLIDLEEADEEEQGGHAFRVLDAYVKSLKNGSEAEDKKKRKKGEHGPEALAILKLLGLFDRPALATSLESLWTGDPIPNLTEPLIDLTEAQRNITLRRLDKAGLLTVNRSPAGELLSIDAHPLLREYFARDLQNDDPDGWRAAHRRLYEHLCETTNEGDQPTLEDLEPLFQAVAHGCLAESKPDAHDKVYSDRLMRNDEFYSSKILGALGSCLGAVANFFEIPWSRVSPALTEFNQTLVLGEAAFYLRALGRLTESLEPMCATMTMMEKQEIWEQSAIAASNLSEVDMALGDVSSALSHAERSVTFADRSGNTFQRMTKRVRHADALHQSGRRHEANALFREAEQMQADDRSTSVLLRSLQGFMFHDLLLAASERCAWQACLHMNAESLGIEASALSTNSYLDTLDSITDRAANNLKLAKNKNVAILAVAFDHLTLSRASLYKSLLYGLAVSLSVTQSSGIKAAVSGLRRAGQQIYLPLGLLTRSWQRSLFGRKTGQDSAQSDLDEAWEIASRGPMPLFMADIHLHRARLFGRLKDEGGKMKDSVYPWESVEHDLSEARRLIEKHGYGRRKEELEDAEAALLGH